MHMLCHAHLGWYNQHSCIAEAYKSRGRDFQDRKLRHLVTSKAGCNQASGSFLSAVCSSRYTAGLRGERPVSQNWWRKHYSGYFYTGFLLIKRQSNTFQWQRKKGFYSQCFFDRLYVWQQKNAVLFVRGKFILVRDQWVTAGTAIRGL